MAKYECKVCGYIYNEQHASRSFEELTECPICNEGKENFITLEADTVVSAPEEEKVQTADEDIMKAEEMFVKETPQENVTDVFGENKDAETLIQNNSSASEDFVSMYKEIKAEESEVVTGADATEAVSETPEFVVERRQEFWTPLSAKTEKKEENNNTTGWTISNARGSVETVIGSSSDLYDKEEEVKTEEVVKEDDDMPAYASRIESFYSSSEPVGTSHIISGDEEEEPFKPLWNSGGGTVQRVIDPFGDRSEPVVKAENVGMVMPAEEPVVEEILGEEVEEAPEVTEEVAEGIEQVTEVAEEAKEEVFFFEDDEEIEPERTETVEDVQEAVAEVSEDVKDSFEFADEEEDDFFTEMTMDAVVENDADWETSHEHGDSGITEEDVFKAIDAIEFDEDVPEGGRIEVVTGDDEDGFTFETVFDDEDVQEEPVEEVIEAVAEEPVEDVFEAATEKPVEDVFEAVTEEPVEEVIEAVAEESVEEVVEAVAEESETEAVAEEKAEEPIQAADEEEGELFFEDFDEIPVDDDKDDFEVEEEPVAVEEEPAVVAAAEEEPVADSEAPRIKAWSFLDDVVEAGAGVAGVTFVAKSMDEVIEDDVTEDDIEEVFVDFEEESSAEESPAEESKTEKYVAEETIRKEEPSYCNHLEKILIVPAQLNPMPLPEGTEVEGKTILGIASDRPLVLDNPVFSTGDYNMVQYIPNSGLTSEDYQNADAIEIIVGHGNGIEKTINSKEDLRQVVNFLRLESDGCPIGIKMGAARIERDLEFCVFAKPDYVVLNDFSVVPLAYALHRATKFLNTVQSGMDIVIALDGAKDAEELAKIMAMGADVIALRNRPAKMEEMVEGLKHYARITGHYDVEDLNVKDLCTIDREIAEFTDIYHV